MNFGLSLYEKFTRNFSFYSIIKDYETNNIEKKNLIGGNTLFWSNISDLISFVFNLKENDQVIKKYLNDEYYKSFLIKFNFIQDFRLFDAFFKFSYPLRQYLFKNFYDLCLADQIECFDIIIKIVQLDANTIINLPDFNKEKLIFNFHIEDIHLKIPNYFENTSSVLLEYKPRIEKININVSNSISSNPDKMFIVNRFKESISKLNIVYETSYFESRKKKEKIGQQKSNQFVFGM